MEEICVCDHYMSEHQDLFGRCTAKNCPCTAFRKPSPYDSTLSMVINSLVERFGRLPTDTEVYRFIWGGPEMRKKIWNDKGLPQTESKRETDESLSIDGKEQ